MVNPTLMPFKAEHTLLMNYRDDDARESVDTALFREQGGPAFTAMLGARVLGSAGIIFMWPGVAGAWAMISTDLMKTYPVWTTRNVRRCIREWFRIFNLHRLEAEVLADNQLNIAWLEMLGFSPEGGVAHAYTSDKRTMLRYELLTPNNVTLRVAHMHETMDGFRTIVALVDDRVVGRASYGMVNYVYAYGHAVEIDEPYRQQGIGDRLHKMRLHDARKHGAQFFIGFTKNTSMASILANNNGTPTISDDVNGIAYVTPLKD